MSFKPSWTCASGPETTTWPTAGVGQASRISAILLAAGQSRRLGRPKQLLPFGAKTVIETCLDHLLASDADEVIVVLGYGYQQIRAQIEYLPVTCILNPDYSQGMSSSVKAGVRAISGDAQAVVVALVNQPLVTADVINQLISAYLQGGHRIIVPEFEGQGGHPILIDLVYRDEMLRIDPQIGLRQIIREHRDEIFKLPLETDAVVRYLRTWEDYQLMLTQVEQRLQPHERRCEPNP